MSNSCVQKQQESKTTEKVFLEYFLFFCIFPEDLSNQCASENICGTIKKKVFEKKKI